MRATAALLAFVLAGCARTPSSNVAVPALAHASGEESPSSQVFPEAQAAAFLREIDPLGGTWRLVAFDGQPISPGRRALLHGHEGAYLATSGDCTSSDTSYIRDGARIEVTRHIPPQTGKCEDAAAAVLDRALAHAVASAQAWSIDAAGRLRLTGAGGSDAIFERPVPKWPELHGPWLVESIDDRPFAGRIEFGDDAVGAHAACNTFGGQAAIGAGTLQVRDGMQTLIGCGPEREATDALLFGALGGARTWRIAGDGSLLIDGAATIVARRPKPASYSLPGRYHVCNNSTLPDLSHDGEVWLEFGAGTVRDQAGCVASYETAGATLRLLLGEAPACRTAALPRRGAAEIGGPRSALAQFRPDGFAWDEEGRLRLRTHRGLLALCKAAG